ncbi:UDP-glucoronosyl and UDP-glucosyl transferase family protein [Aphelenchoides avenae]|nr:UDP-glucoronosyl and UDP-glucosyl transferase family protein [Aphelenchus avenae]
MTSTLVLIFLLLTVVQVRAYKILAYAPKFTASHVMLMGRIADVLHEAGHEVVMYEPVYNPSIKENGSYSVRIIERTLNLTGSVPHVSWKSTWGSDTDGFGQTMNIISRLVTTLRNGCERQLFDADIIKLLRTEHFDIALGDIYDPCASAVTANCKCRSCVWDPTHTEFHLIRPSSPAMTYRERFINAIAVGIIQLMHPFTFTRPIAEVVSRRMGREVDLISPVGRSSYLFVNADEHLDFPRPVSHKVIYVGGVGVNPRPLDKNFDDILESAVQGVVLVSFGNVVQSSAMPNATKWAFLRAFASFPTITFLWKHGDRDDPEVKQCTNVVPRTWVPQKDLLGHPKLLAFITHAGANSVMEAALAGVPMICIPMFGDGMRNAKMAEYRGIARIVKKKELSAETLTDAIKSVILDKR